jgi:AcrR family transcriptional regulator
MADVNVATGQPRPVGTGSAVADRPKRQRNPRGQGSRLRDEIIAGAAALLERTGTETAITLRAVAREVGIAPPSMTPHFAERAEIIDAVVAQELGRLHDALFAAVDAESDPAEKAFAAARAYLAFGQAHPNRYRVIFERRFLTLWDREQRVMRHTAPQMAETFDLVVRTLQGCIDAGRSSSTDAFADGVAIWFALHGMVALPPAITSFPWPDTEKLLISCITRLARIQEPPRCG